MTAQFHIANSHPPKTTLRRLAFRVLPRRIWVATRVLRGHPVAYRLLIYGLVALNQSTKGVIVECDIRDYERYETDRKPVMSTAPWFDTGTAK